MLIASYVKRHHVALLALFFALAGRHSPRVTRSCPGTASARSK